MFEEYTQEYFIELAQQKAAERNIDATEGTLVFNAACLMAIMLEDAFDKAEEAYTNIFPDTADREHLIRFGRDVGIEPRGATSCTVKIHTDGDFSEGTKLTGSEFSYTVLRKISEEEDGSFFFEAECDTAGTTANGAFGSLSAEGEGTTESFCDITEILTPGADDEETEEFRNRYFESNDIPPESGNRSYYKTAAENINGVGAAKVFGTTEGGKSIVNIWIVGNDYVAASEEVRAKAQKAIDPTDGKGDGIANVDHFARVFSAGETAVDLSISVTAEKGTTKSELTEEIKDTVTKYFETLNRDWDSVNALSVKASVIEARIMLLGSIADVTVNIGSAGTVRVKSLENNLGKAGKINVSYLPDVRMD